MDRQNKDSTYEAGEKEENISNFRFSQSLQVSEAVQPISSNVNDNKETLSEDETLEKVSDDKPDGIWKSIREYRNSKLRTSAVSSLSAENTQSSELDQSLSNNNITLNYMFFSTSININENKGVSNRYNFSSSNCLNCNRRRNSPSHSSAHCSHRKCGGESKSARQTTERKESLKKICIDAIDCGDIITIQYLLINQQLNPNFECDLKNPICRAAGLGDINILTMLIKAGADVNTRDSSDVLYEKRPIHIAAAYGHFSALQCLVANGADINQLDSDQRTPLHWIAVYGHTHMINWMISVGACLNLAQKDGFTPLHFATCVGKYEVCHLLIKAGAEMSRRDRDGWTPLHSAICYDFYPIVKLMLDAGASPMLKTSNANDSTLHTACSKGNEELVDLLLDMGVPIECKNSSGFTPLHTAVYYNRIKVVKRLLFSGANVNTRSYKGSTPAYLAMVRGETDILKLLLAANCNGVEVTESMILWKMAPKLASEISERVSSPTSLQNQAVLLIRQQLAPYLQTHASKLPLPVSLKDYIALKCLETYP